MELRALAIGLGAAVVVLGLLQLRVLIRGWMEAFRARLRSFRARRGEREAEALLEGMGYRILERQAERRWEIEVDGAPRSFLVRADLIVRRKGRLYVAEVKTGAAAPRLRTASTRRQLLEYAHAYEAEAVLLVDVEAGEVHELRFPPMSASAAPRRGFSGLALLAAMAAGAIGAALSLQLHSGLPSSLHLGVLGF